mgnify:CR=1 FL=1
MIEDVSRASRLPNGSDVEAQLTAFADIPPATQLLHGRWSFVDRHWRGALALDPFEALLVERLRAGRTLEQAVDEVVLGQVLQAGAGMNVARQLGLRFLDSDAVLERRLGKKNPGYEDYVRRTSAFIPLPPKRA